MNYQIYTTIPAIASTPTIQARRKIYHGMKCLHVSYLQTWAINKFARDPAVG